MGIPLLLFCLAAPVGGYYYIKWAFAKLGKEPFRFWKPIFAVYCIFALVASIAVWSMRGDELNDAALLGAASIAAHEAGLTPAPDVTPRQVADTLRMADPDLVNRLAKRAYRAALPWGLATELCLVGLYTGFMRRKITGDWR
jgi:hypothetical protein